MCLASGDREPRRIETKLIWPAQLIDLWHDWVTQETYNRQGSSTKLLSDWKVTLDLRHMPLTMRHAGFTDAKLAHLYRTYPVDALPADGCIAAIAAGNVTWRRVDACRGLIADLVYLRELGLGRVVCRFEQVRLHKVRLGVILPKIRTLDHIPNESMRLDSTRECRYRLERKFDNHDSTRRMNDWAHLINTRSEMETTLRRLA